MNIVELIDRSNFLLTKYEKYTVEENNEKKKTKGKGAFEELYVDLLDQINALTLRGEETRTEVNRAAKAAQNAELRKAKAKLLETEVPKLQKLVRRGKNLTQENLDERHQKVQQIQDGIAAIADGVSGSRSPQKPLKPISTASKFKGHVTLSTELHARQQSPGYYKQTEASAAFQQEWKVAKGRQDKALENIEKGLGVLKGLGEAMNENLSQQDVLLMEADAKMDLAQKAVKTNSMKLKGLVTQMRSSKNFCIDVALICILLAMALWIYQLFK